MASSLLAALGGLRAHQSWIDVIGNNLANANTPGYKSSRTLFSELISQKIRSATPPTGAVGGTNPIQVGLGVVMDHTDRNHSQGPLNLTGRPLDLALVGDGFFTLSNGATNVYSRVGTFGMDGDKNVVDVRTGYKLVGRDGLPLSLDVDAVRPPQQTTQLEFAGNLPSQVTGPLAQLLQTASTLNEGTQAVVTGTDNDLTGLSPSTAYGMELVVNGGVPTQISVTSDATGEIDIDDVIDEINNSGVDAVASDDGTGLLVLTNKLTGEKSTIKVNPSSGDDLAAELGLTTNQVTGTQTTATSTSNLNDLVNNLTDYSDGDAIEITGTDADGSSLASTFTFGAGNDGTTIDDVVAFIDNLFSGASASFNESSGKIELSADATGVSELSLVIDDGNGATGSTNWALNGFAVNQNGAGPDTVTTSTEIFDVSGLSHIVTFNYERQDDGSWTMRAEMDEEEGEVLTPALTGISFNIDGSMQTGPTPASLEVQFKRKEGVGGNDQFYPAQSVELNLGEIGGIGGLTQFGGSASVAIEGQDGAPTGELASLSVDGRGVIIGFFTNGEIEELEEIGIATFANELGLEAAGDNYFAETPNSGQRVLGGGLVGGAGEVVGGALEESNVDTAEEFVRLIQAQRGFQANARVITVQDEMFAEIVRIV